MTQQKTHTELKPLIDAYAVALDAMNAHKAEREALEHELSALTVEQLLARLELATGELIDDETRASALGLLDTASLVAIVAHATLSTDELARSLALVDARDALDDACGRPARDNAHVLMPEWVAALLPPLYATESEHDPLVFAKYFTPDSSWTWYVTEYDARQDLCFGLVDGLERELGYISLNELRGARGPMGLRIERDIFWRPTRLSVVKSSRAS